MRGGIYRVQVETMAGEVNFYERVKNWSWASSMLILDMEDGGQVGMSTGMVKIWIAHPAPQVFPI
jgi:hypothetical protein